MTPVIEQHNRRRFPRAAYGIILAAVGCAALLVLAAGPDGRPAVTSNSFQYFSMGEHAAAGEGFRSCCAAWDSPPGSDPPVAADWGPGYPLVLAGIEAAGVDPQGRALLWANAGWLGVSLLLVGALVYRFTRRAGWAVLAILLMMSGYFADSHLYAWSEPLFMTLLLGGIVALLVYLEAGSRWGLACAALMFGLAWLTRYAGLVFVEIATGAVVFRAGQPRRRRLEDAVIFAVIAHPPVTLWNAYTQSLPADSVRRYGLALHSMSEISADTARALLHLYGHPVYMVMFLAGGVWLIGRTGGAWWRTTAADESRWGRLARRATSPAGVLIIMAAAYAVFIPATATIRFIQIDSPRLLVPMSPFLVLMLIAGVRTLDGLWRGLVVGALLVWIAFRLLAFYDEAQARFQSRAALDNDPSLAWIKTNLAEATLYSNNYDYLAYVLPDADVRDLPLHAAGDRVPSAFVEQVGGGYVVFLDYNQRTYLLRESDVVDSQQFDLVMTLPRARVYQLQGHQPTGMANRKLEVLIVMHPIEEPDS